MIIWVIFVVREPCLAHHPTPRATLTLWYTVKEFKNYPKIDSLQRRRF